MVEDDGGRGLLRFQQELLGQRDADTLRADEFEQTGLVVEVGACRVAKRIAATAVVPLEELADGR